MATRASSSSASVAPTRSRRRQSIPEPEEKFLLPEVIVPIVSVERMLSVPRQTETEGKPPQKRRRRNTGPADEETVAITPPSTDGASSKISSFSTEPRNLRRRTRRMSQVTKSPTPPPQKQQTECIYRLGDKLEAQDEYGKWYSARVTAVDEEANSVLIHFDYWSTRYDEWIGVKSHRLRPLIEQPRQNEDSMYKIGDFVLAKWSMSKHYPAKILDVVNESRFNVLFYDGFESVVRRRELRKMPEEEMRKLDLSNFGEPGYVLPSAKPADQTGASSSQTITAPDEKQGYVVKKVRKKERFLTTTQKWMLRQMEDNRSQRKAAVGVSLAVSQLTPTARRRNKKGRVEDSSGGSRTALTAPVPQGETTKHEAKQKKTKQIREQTSASRKVTRRSSDNLPLSALTSEKERSSDSPVAETSYDPIVRLKSVKEEEGAAPLSVVRRTQSRSVDGSSAYYRLYKFKPEWTQEFEWIRYENGSMYCEYCRRSYPEAKHGFVQGISSGFLVHRLVGHERSRFHLTAVEQAGKASGQRVSQELPRKEDETISKHLRNVKSEGDDNANEDGVSVIVSTPSSDAANGDTSERAQRLFLFWRNGREAWLRMENDKFFCHACRLHGANTGPANLWRTGVPLNQASNIRRHSQSPSHLAALQQLTDLEAQGGMQPPGFDQKPASAIDNNFSLSSSHSKSSTPPKAESSGSRKRKLSLESEASLDSTSCGHSVSTVTAGETCTSHQSSADRKRHSSQERQEDMTDREDSPPSSSLSHLAEDDVVRCVCETGGEDGLMLQCEQCLTWQHGGCVGISEAEATPSAYICYICKDPPGSRRSMRYRYEVQKTWLETGVLPRYPWSIADTPADFVKTKVAQSTNNASRAISLLNDRLRATRTLIQQANKIPHGPNTIDRKAAIKDEIIAIQNAVEKQLDVLEPFVTDLENKYFVGRTPAAEEQGQSKLAICALLRDLDKLRKLEYFLQ